MSLDKQESGHVSKKKFANRFLKKGYHRSSKLSKFPFWMTVTMLKLVITLYLAHLTAGLHLPTFQPLEQPTFISVVFFLVKTTWHDLFKSFILYIKIAEISINLGLDTETKTQIRTTLTSFLLERHAQLLYFVKNKLAKLIVDVGRHDWPHFYPDFMDNIFSLIQTPSTSLLGLVLLQVRLY